MEEGLDLEGIFVCIYLACSETRALFIFDHKSLSYGTMQNFLKTFQQPDIFAHKN